MDQDVVRPGDDLVDQSGIGNRIVRRRKMPSAVAGGGAAVVRSCEMYGSTSTTRLPDFISQPAAPRYSSCKSWVWPFAAAAMADTHSASAARRSVSADRGAPLV